MRKVLIALVLAAVLSMLLVVPALAEPNDNAAPGKAWGEFHKAADPGWIGEHASSVQQPAWGREYGARGIFEFHFPP
jgi:hypothetical protein